jgi:arsenate reductase (glutaredoxin)
VVTAKLLPQVGRTYARHPFAVRGTEYDRTMSDIRLLHNPKCSKSRQALELLRDRGIDPEIVLYLDTPPDRATLELIVSQLDDPSRLVRKDPHFKELGLSAADYTEDGAVVDLLLEHPRLMERPVAIKGGRAVLGRPPEDILDLVDG